MKKYIVILILCSTLSAMQAAAPRNAAAEIMQLDFAIRDLFQQEQAQLNVIDGLIRAGAPVAQIQQARALLQGLQEARIEAQNRLRAIPIPR